MQTTDTIRATVAALLTEPGPLWEANLVAHYRERALGATKHAVERFSAGDKEWYNRVHLSKYVLFPKQDDAHRYRCRDFPELCQLARDGKVTTDLDRATDDAKRAYREARDTFIEHVTEKLACCFANDAVLHVHGKIGFQGMITGAISAEQHLPSLLGGVRVRARFGIVVQVKTNYRYGENSENRVITQYHQYPITVNFVEVDGVLISAANSIEQAAFAISGRNPTSEAAAARKARVDAKTAYREKLIALERLKRQIDDRYTSLRYFVEGVKYHKGNEGRIAEILAKAEFTAVDKLLAAHKTVAAELKAAREAVKVHKAVKP